jgi:hypothetical protein
VFGAASLEPRPSASIVRQESQNEAKRKKSALSDWADAEAELAAIERELSSTQAAIVAIKTSEPEPESEELELDDMVTAGGELLVGRPASAVTAARDQLSALRRHHERCRSLLANPPVAPSQPISKPLDAAQRVAAEEAAQRRRRAELTKVEALVASIEDGQLSPEDLVGMGPTEEEVMRDIIPIAVPRKR